MTIGAELMSLGRRLLLAAMAAAACRRLRPGMRLMAARAASMARLDQTGFALVAAGASNLVGFRVVRQPAVATGTFLVPLVRRDLLNARGVTRLTRRHVAQR